MQAIDSTTSTSAQNTFTKIWKKIRTLTVVASIFGLASLNILSLVSDYVHGLGFGIIKAVLASAMPDANVSKLLRNSPTATRTNEVATATKVLKEEKVALAASKRVLEVKHANLEKSHTELARTSAARTATTQKISKRLATRAVVNATRNSSAVFAESIPYFGVAVVLGVTALDLRDTCETLKDMNELNAAFELGQEDPTKVCGMKVPTKDEVLSRAKTEWNATIKAAKDALRNEGISVN